MFTTFKLLAHDIFRGLSTLVFPQICIMCDEQPGDICRPCHSSWISPPCKTRLGNVPIYFVATYDSRVSRVILKAKEERNRCAQRIVAEALYRSIQALKATNFDDFVLVPIPSSTQATRRRGEAFLHPILSRVLIHAKTNGEHWSWHELLIHKKKVRDQAGLNSQQRRENLEDVFKVRDGIYESRPIIVVDDVMTTGSTLWNAISALNERKMTVLGAVTACASSHHLLIP